MARHTYKHFLGTAMLIAATLLPLPAFAQYQDSDTPPAVPETPAATSPETTEPPAGVADPTTTETSQPADTPQPASISAEDTGQASIQLENDINSSAASGSAAVQGNIEAGNASSGQAAASATVINIANTNGLQAIRPQSFECNLRDNYQGNLLIDPASLLPICSNTTQPAPQSGNAASSLQTGGSLVNLLNTIVLGATSGDAAVTDNVSAGSATSGDATALANVVNIANSAINAKQSFVGVINIYSELKGDILVPSWLVDSLAGGAHGATNHATQTATTITNNLTADASGGHAGVTDNTSAGSAQSGDAATSLTVLNLTGQQIVAKNSLLVFVNVLGKWMGLVVPAPGSKTAILGSGVQSGSGAGSSLANNAAWQDGETSTTNITNNIAVTAKSGDATVSGNTEAGNATSGKAMAGINLLNITDSQFLLDDWFGALFVNVLGSWLGDFDIQASAPSSSTPDPAKPAQPIQDVRVFQLQQPVAISRTPAASTANAPNTSGSPAAATETVPAEAASKVLGASSSPLPGPANQDQAAANWRSMLLVAGIIGLLAVVAGRVVLRQL